MRLLSLSTVFLGTLAVAHVGQATPTLREGVRQWKDNLKQKLVPPPPPPFPVCPEVILAQSLPLSPRGRTAWYDVKETPFVEIQMILRQTYVDHCWYEGPEIDAHETQTFWTDRDPKRYTRGCPNCFYTRDEHGLQRTLHRQRWQLRELSKRKESS